MSFPAAPRLPVGSLRQGSVKQASRAKGNRMPGSNASAGPQFSFDNAPPKSCEAPPREQEPGSHGISELEPLPLRRLRPQHGTETEEIPESEDILDMVPQGIGLAARRPLEMDPGSQPEQKIVAFKDPGILNPRINIPAVDKFFPSQSPNSR